MRNICNSNDVALKETQKIPPEINKERKQTSSKQDFILTASSRLDNGKRR